MIDIFDREEVILKRKIGIEFNGKAKLGEPETIMCRVSYKRQLVKSKTGKEVVSEVTCYTKTQVATGDYLTIEGRDQEIISVSPRKNLDSSIICWVVVL